MCLPLTIHTCVDISKREMGDGEGEQYILEERDGARENEGEGERKRRREG